MTTRFGFIVTLASSKMNKQTAYWLCQTIGWAGMIIIEMSNYTFFILREFNLNYLFQFSILAVLGLLLTHAYRYYLKKTGYFSSHHPLIWAFAFISTIILSLILTILFLLPNLISDLKGTISTFSWIDIIGSVYNWMRYFGVWVIIYFLYKILQQNHTIQQEKLLIENNARTAELELLKAQLNPHFLFNALNSIKALVSIDPEQSRDAIVKLSELLRFTLQYNKEQEIPLREELAEVKKYLELEELRFGERLTVQYCVSEQVQSAMIPPAMLLTLAENAVKHGIGQSSKPGVIIIEASCPNDILIIQMKNTGLYTPADKPGIGLLHINRRLEKLYNGKAVLQLENKENLVVATLKIPQ
jgi:sensor histidine kinase YesM